MDKRLLVAYASKHGATAEIAERIGEKLRRAGLSVDVLSADRAGDPAAYAAVVLGSASYIGGWRKAAAKFLRDNERTLAARPVWLFSSGPTGAGDPAALMQGWRFPKALQPVADRIQPKEIAIFHGALDAKKLSWFERWIAKNVKAPLGDFRDWEAIESWAAKIYEAMT